MIASDRAVPTRQRLLHTIGRRTLTRRAATNAVPALALAAVLALAGCGDDGDADDGSADSATTSTAPPPAATWVGETLDGEPVVIVDGRGPPSFQDGLPSPILLITQAIAGGCDALQLEFNYWETQADADTDQGRYASAYADFAQDERRKLGC